MRLLDLYHFPVTFILRLCLFASAFCVSAPFQNRIFSLSYVPLSHLSMFISPTALIEIFVCCIDVLSYEGQIVVHCRFNNFRDLCTMCETYSDIPDSKPARTVIQLRAGKQLIAVEWATSTLLRCHRTAPALTHTRLPASTASSTITICRRPRPAPSMRVRAGNSESRHLPVPGISLWLQL